jgi:hypothetical protein
LYYLHRYFEYVGDRDPETPGKYRNEDAISAKWKQVINSKRRGEKVHSILTGLGFPVSINTEGWNFSTVYDENRDRIQGLISKLKTDRAYELDIDEDWSFGSNFSKGVRTSVMNDLIQNTVRKVPDRVELQLYQVFGTNPIIKWEETFCLPILKYLKNYEQGLLSDEDEQPIAATKPLPDGFATWITRLESAQELYHQEILTSILNFPNIAKPIEDYDLQLQHLLGRGPSIQWNETFCLPVLNHLKGLAEPDDHDKEELKKFISKWINKLELSQSRPQIEPVPEQ